MSEHSAPKSLKRKSVIAVLWSGFDIFIRQGLQVVVSVILARLLSPEEFGTVALLYLFTGLATLFVDSGFSSALVQQRDITRTDESTVFWINLLMGVLMTGLLWLAAPWIADFYNIPILTQLMEILAITVFLYSLCSVHFAVLGKKLAFKTIMKVGVVSTILSGGVAVAMAIYGYGIWSLAIQAVVNSFVSACLLWSISGWRPCWIFSFHSAHKLFKFGSYLMLSGLLDVAYNRINTLLIGKFYGVRDLAFYSRADNTKQIPVDMLSGMLSRVAFPIFSAAAHDKEQLKRGVRHAVRGVMLVNIPLMLGLMATAESAIFVMFGGKWLAAVPVLRILCVAGVFWPLHVINLNVLKAQGYSNLFFRLELIKKIVGISLLVLGVTYYGVMGIAWCQVAFGFVGFFINAYYTGRYLGYGAFRQIGDFLPALGVSLVMSVAVFVAGGNMTVSPFLILPMQIVLGGVLFVAFCVVFRIKAFNEAINLLLRRS